MALTLDGSSGYLQFSGALVSTFPCSIVICTSGPNPSGLSIPISQSQTSVDRGIYGAHDSAAITYASLRNPGNSDSASQAGAPHLSNSALNILVCVYTSATSRTVYYGTATGSSSSTTMLNDLSYHNLITVGALQWNGTGAGAFFNGAVEEAHFFNSALTSGNVTSMMGGTLPETLSGWVDGWTLQSYSGGGTYASIGGSNTLTAHGGVTSSALAHYFTRTVAPTLSSPTGSATGSTTATIGATTDTGSGTMYAVVTTSSTNPSSAQIKAGQDATGAAAAYSSSASIGATGAHTFSATGLTASTSYYGHLIQTASALDSNIVVTSSFTTSSGGGAFYGVPYYELLIGKSHV